MLVDYHFDEEDFGALSYHRIVEAFKFAYAQRLKLGDPFYNDSVTAVSLTTDSVSKNEEKLIVFM